MKKVIWSLYPHDKYTVEHNGQLVGIGARPIWDAIPGSWNILSMLWGQGMEDLIPWGGSNLDFPYDCNLAPYAVALALQSRNSQQTWGEFADISTPREFVEELRKAPDSEVLIPIYVFKNRFWELAEDKARTYRKLHDNVTRVNFAARR